MALAVLLVSMQSISAGISGCGVEDRVVALRRAYVGFAAPDTTQRSVRAFFEALPDSFECYQVVFGYPSGPLYEEPQMHEVFPRLKVGVSPSEYFKKVVRLSIGATWEADQIGALWAASQDALVTNPATFVRELAKLPHDLELSVWQFLFSGPHPSNVSLSAETKGKVCSVSPRSCSLSERAYERALERERREH